MLRAVQAAVLLSACAHAASNSDFDPLERPSNELHNPLELYNDAALQHSLQAGIKLQVNITTLQRSGEWVEVSWSGVKHPDAQDFIAVFVPADGVLPGRTSIIAVVLLAQHALGRPCMLSCNVH